MKEDLIYKMLFSEEKVELSSEKVELAGVDELRKALKGGEAAMKSAKKASSDYEDARRVIIREIQRVGGFVETMEKYKAEFAKAVKALGLKPTDVKEYSEIDEKITALKGFVSMYERQLGM